VVGLIAFFRNGSKKKLKQLRRPRGQVGDKK